MAKLQWPYELQGLGVLQLVQEVLIFGMHGTALLLKKYSAATLLE
jgi:hypothetical protein